MTVYELIQELSQYNADTEVEFHVNAEFDTDVEVEFDRDISSDIHEVTVTVDFDDNVDFSSIADHERYTARPRITINLEY